MIIKYTIKNNMNRITGVLSYTLRGTNGWSDLSLNKIDVGMVVSTNVKKRLFCLFDRDKPYTLHINYGYERRYNPITKRYSNIEDANDDVNNILKKQEFLEENIKIFKE